nr:zinc finger, CCHC-type [Tanacetum cinerariifolium]
MVLMKLCNSLSKLKDTIWNNPSEEEGGENPTVKQVRRMAKWDNDDYVCRGLILNGMSDSFFDIYQNVETSKELWDTLEAKYMAEDASNFKHTSKHLKEELTLIELGSHLRIKESLKVQVSDKPKGNNVVGPSVFNMMEHNNSSRYNDNNGKRKHHDIRANPNKKPKVTCWKCRKPRHLKKDCKAGNDDDVAWWVDFGATVHVCKDRWHVHFKRMQDMSKDGLIPAIDIDTEKCKTCMLNKITKKPFQNVKSETKVLELIHNDLCDLHATPLLGNKNYSVTFIDDASRFCYVYLLHLKDKALDKFKVFKTEVKLQQESLIKRLRTNRGGSGGSVVSKRFNDKIVLQSEPKLKKSKRHRTPKDFWPEFQLYLIEGTRDEVSDQHSYFFNVEDDPKTFDKAIKSHDVAFWKETINDEMDSIIGNNTWVLTDLPLGCRPVGCKWIFKRKLKVDGTVKKFKARLIIQGFKQKSGMDYFDTYAPMARISTIRLLIAMASIHYLIIHQMDVKTAFLNRELEEGVYMNQPLGFIMLGDENKVDLIKEFLSSRFSMKDMREADVILGIRIKHESNGIEISQSHYIEKVLKKFNYSDCTSVSTPLDTYEKLMPNKGLAVSQLEYSRVIGCLMYAMTCTRPNITFVVGKLSRYTSNPGTRHWQAIQKVLKYLKKTIDYRLVYSCYPSVLEGYTDVSWISNTKDNSSTSGWVFLLGGGAISWASKKQTCIIGSIMESEFVALAAAGKEAEWLKNLLFEIPLQMYNGKSRHLGVSHSMIHDLITNGVGSEMVQRFWGEAMLIAFYLLNRVPNKRNKTTPYKFWTKKPNLNYLRVWGFRADPKLRKSKRHRTPKDFGPEFQLYLIEGTRYEVSDQHSYFFNVEDDPKTFDKAIKSQDVAFWKETINDEMDSIIGNNTWVLTDLPLGCRPVGCKWIFKRKLKVDGTVKKFKAMLIIQGFKQKSGMDYFDTYAPVARISTITLLIAMASIHYLIIHQMDVKTAFLNGELEEGVYMNQPLGFIMLGDENKVCKLIKSLYRLKQAPKQWHQKFNEVVLSNGYLLNQADKYVYSKFDASGKGVIICLYVDKMLIFGTDQVQVDLIKEFLSSGFSIKDMREADVILGIRIKHESNGIEISQSHYIEKVLKKFNYSDCTSVSTPLDTYEKLMPNKGLAVSQLEYSRVIGCLMYAMTCTRPNITFVVGKLSRYTSNPGTRHWQAIQKVLKYLKKTIDYRLVYSCYPSVLEAAGKEAEWLKNLLFEIPLWVKPMAPISIRCDSAATLAKVYSQMYNGKSRHLGVSHSMIRELITNGVVSIEFVRSQQNLADHLTK